MCSLGDKAELAGFQPKTDRLPCSLHLPQKKKNLENPLGSKRAILSPGNGESPAMSLAWHSAMVVGQGSTIGLAATATSEEGLGFLRVRRPRGASHTLLLERWGWWPGHADSQCHTIQHL